jgi:hypothetical protein
LRHCNGDAGAAEDHIETILTDAPMTDLEFLTFDDGSLMKSEAGSGSRYCAFRIVPTKRRPFGRYGRYPIDAPSTSSPGPFDPPIRTCWLIVTAAKE